MNRLDTAWFPFFHFLKCVLSASVAQSDALPTGDQEVAGSNRPGTATFFRGDWS